MYDVLTKDKLSKLFTDELKKNITEINAKTDIRTIKAR